MVPNALAGLKALSAEEYETWKEYWEGTDDGSEGHPARFLATIDALMAENAELKRQIEGQAKNMHSVSDESDVFTDEELAALKDTPLGRKALRVHTRLLTQSVGLHIQLAEMAIELYELNEPKPTFAQRVRRRVFRLIGRADAP